MLKSALGIVTLLVLAGAASAHPGHVDSAHALGSYPDAGLVAIVVVGLMLASAHALRRRGLAASRSDRRPPTA